MTANSSNQVYPVYNLSGLSNSSVSIQSLPEGVSIKFFPNVSNEKRKQIIESLYFGLSLGQDSKEILQTLMDMKGASRKIQKILK